MIRVLHIIPDDGIGGVELAARFVARRQDGRVRLLFLDREPVDPVEPLEHVAYARGRPGGLGSALFALREARRWQPDVIVFSLWKTWLAFLLIRLLGPRARLVTFLHLEKPHHLVDALLTGMQMRLSHGVWADSRHTLVKRLGRGAGSPRARTISFVLHKPDGRVRGAPSARFAFWGRLKIQKRVDRAIRLVSRLKGAELMLIGPDGGEEATARALAAELGVAAAFPGPRDFAAIEALAKDASFFIQLSTHEGMSMSTVEAMQLGLVPVVTPVGEIARYCRHMDNAIVFSDEAQAARDIEAVLADPALFARLSAAAIDQWRAAPLYDEDFMAAAGGLARSEV